MDISKFKSFIQNILKSYSSLLVPVVIGVVGVLVFMPTRLMNSKLQKRIAGKSISVGNSIKSLSKSAVPRGQWKVEQEYELAFEEDAKQTALLARQSTQREILSYKIFPEPKDTSTLIFGDFSNQFREAMYELIGRVNGRDCPTETELKRGLQSTVSSGSRWGRGSFFGRSLDKSSKVDAMIREVLCREKAELASVYANPADLSGYTYWGEYKYADMVDMKEAVKDCWYWQLGYWIVEDVIDTIGAENFGSDGVFTSPVKRLLSVSFTSGAQGLRSGRKGSKAKDRPGYALSIQDGFAEPWTGRLCNSDIDVVQFKVAVVVSTKAILPFMHRLCSAKQHKFGGFFGQGEEQLFRHNQITILESGILPVDRKDKSHELYRYGEDAAVELDLTCEYIFNKAGYDDIKPESIKELLKTKLNEQTGSKK